VKYSTIACVLFSNRFDLIRFINFLIKELRVYFISSAIAVSSSFSFQDPANPQKIKQELHADEVKGHFIVLLVDMVKNCISIIDPMGRQLDSIEGFSSDMIRRWNWLNYFKYFKACNKDFGKIYFQCCLADTTSISTMAMCGNNSTMVKTDTIAEHQNQ